MQSDIDRLRQILDELKAIRLKILVVDDDHIFRDMLKMYFPDIEEAADGEEAILLLNKKKYDLVLVDLRLPGITGFAVLDHIRKTGNGIPVVLSGFLSEEDVKQCGRAVVVDKQDTNTLIGVIEHFGRAK